VNHTTRNRRRERRPREQAERQQQSADHVHDRGDDREYGGVRNRLPEHRVVSNRAVKLLKPTNSTMPCGLIVWNAL
jgi:hypothetical protein